MDDIFKLYANYYEGCGMVGLRLRNEEPKRLLRRSVKGATMLFSINKNALTPALFPF